MLAKNKYNSELAKIATQLYESAYKEYKDSIDYEFDKMDMLKSLENSDYSKYKDELDNYNKQSELSYNQYRDDMEDYYTDIENSRLDDEFEYEKSKDEKQLQYDNQKLDFEIAKWQQQSKTDKYNTLARLIQSVYNKSNIGVNVQRILNIMGN